MKRTKKLRKIGLILLAASLSLETTVAAFGQLPPPTTNSLTPSTVVTDLTNLEFWLVMLVTLVSGAHRVIATLSQKETAETKSKADQQNAKVLEAKKSLDTVKEAIGSLPSSGGPARSLEGKTPTDRPDVQQILEELAKAEQLLNEARTVHDTI